jgi:cyclophilin family peptidyl-prolyl cis-trans isomerase
MRIETSVRLAAGFVIALAALTQAAGAQAPKAAPKAAPKGTAAPQAAVTPSPDAGPILVIETVKGTFEVETYPGDAPKTVAHIVALVNRRFYNGLRIHRVVPGFIVQFGDPQTRDMTKQASWGRGRASQSGKPIGVAEITKRRTHRAGAVAMAHAGDPNEADSQFYVTLAPQPKLDGKYTVFGQVISGFDVPAKLQVPDIIRRITIKPGSETK